MKATLTCQQSLGFLPLHEFLLNDVNRMVLEFYVASDVFNVGYNIIWIQGTYLQSLGTNLPGRFVAMTVIVNRCPQLMRVLGL